MLIMLQLSSSNQRDDEFGVLSVITRHCSRRGWKTDGKWNAQKCFRKACSVEARFYWSLGFGCFAHRKHCAEHFLVRDKSDKKIYERLWGIKAIWPKQICSDSFWVGVKDVGEGCLHRLFSPIKGLKVSKPTDSHPSKVQQQETIELRNFDVPLSLRLQHNTEDSNHMCLPSLLSSPSHSREEKKNFSIFVSSRVVFKKMLRLSMKNYYEKLLKLLFREKFV